LKQVYDGTMMLSPEGVPHLAADKVAVLGGTAMKLPGIKG
jgi:hypothetical protein